MNIKFTLFALLIPLSACKKEQPGSGMPTLLPTDNGSGYRKLACTQFIPDQPVYPSSRHTDYLVAYYEYGPYGQPRKITYKDSVAYDGRLNTKPIATFKYNELYYFTSFLKTDNATTGKGADHTVYTYDAAMRVVLAVTNQKDSTVYTYSNGITKGTTKTGSSTFLYYYSANLDSLIALDATGNRISKVTYFHNATKDLKEAYLNCHRPIVAHLHELVSEVKWLAANNTTTRAYYSYWHDDKGYPTWVTRIDSSAGIWSPVRTDRTYHMYYQ